MHKLIRGEIYRLLHKKSLFLYFGALAVGYFLIAFVRSGGFDGESVVDDALSLFGLLPALAGGFLFAAIYTDDLNAKNLTMLVGFGVNKGKIVIAKFILMAFCGALVFGIMPLYHCAVYAVLGQAATASAAATIAAVSVKYLLTALAFAALSGVAVYGIQRATFALVTYILLAFGVVSGLLAVALDTFAPSLKEHLMSGISDRVFLGLINGGPLTLPLVEYAVYVLIALALSALAFYRKEMEF
ncbi:MAG: hypothetical protein FWE59_03560 [Oscillospiraceae bacterium]|nr:hypothetical protein [Oscillospiraceae bacterium]